MKGIKLHPSMDHYEIGVDVLDEVFAIAERRNVLVASHTDASCPAGTFGPVMKVHPEATLILYHAHPGPEAFAVVNSHPNVYIDVSYLAWGKAFQQQALAAVGRDRILFGIDPPLGFPQKDGVYGLHYRDAAREVAEFYDNDPEVVEAVLHRNAERMLGLSF